MDYKTPQTTFTDAINFDAKVAMSGGGDGNGGGVGSSGGSKASITTTLHSKLNSLLQRLNDSEYVYPTISVLVATILVVICIFQPINIFIKCLMIVILLMLVLYTIYQYRYK